MTYLKLYYTRSADTVLNEISVFKYQISDERDYNEADTGDVGGSADADTACLGRVELAGERVDDQEGRRNHELGYQIKNQRPGHGVCNTRNHRLSPS